MLAALGVLAVDNTSVLRVRMHWHFLKTADVFPAVDLATILLERIALVRACVGVCVF